MRSCFTHCVALVLVCLSINFAPAFAFVPSLVSYQGRLTDGGGLPLTDTVSIKFSIYTGSGGGIALWTETQPAVPVIDGIFNVLLGSVSPIDEGVFDVNVIIDRFLGVSVNGASDLQPLQRFVAVPYAFRVQTIDDASGGVIDGTLTVGTSNSNTGANGFVVGQDNQVSGIRASITGGRNNVASGAESHIGGGEGNLADTIGATVGGGENNSAIQANAVVAGGDGNSASGDRAAILGGTINSASGDWATLGGGFGNIAAGSMSVVAGGNENKATGAFSFVGGGGGSSAFGSAESDSNIASGDYAAVVGGNSQIASGEGAFIGGGSINIATGLYATIPGGRQNQVIGDYGFAAGRRAKANHAGSFVWGDSQNNDFASTAANQFILRALGGVGIGTNAPQAPLHVQESVTGITAHGNSVGLFERNNNTYLSVNSPSSFERGLLFGDQNNSSDGGIIYNNSSFRRGLHVRTGGNLTRMVIDSLGNVGIADNSPSSRVEIGGPIATEVDILTTGTTLDNTHSVVIFEMPQISGAHLVFLPLASTCPGRVYTFKVSAANSDDILLQRQGSDLIDNATTYNIVTDLDFLQLVSDGVSHWYVISERP